MRLDVASRKSELGRKSQSLLSRIEEMPVNYQYLKKGNFSDQTDHIVVKTTGLKFC